MQRKKYIEPTPLTSKEVIPQQGKRRQYHDHPQEHVDPMTSSTMISMKTFSMEITWV